MAFKPAAVNLSSVTLSSLITAPDGRSKAFRLDLADQTKLREFGADFNESRALDRCRRRQATVLASRPSAHHRKLRVGKFDTHDPTLPLIQEVRAIRAPHQDEPRIGQCRWGGWVTALAAPSASDTNASFRTESQSFLHRARNCSEWPDKLLACLISKRNITTASARRSALRFEPDQTQLLIARLCAFRSRKQIPDLFTGEVVISEKNTSSPSLDMLFTPMSKALASGIGTSKNAEVPAPLAGKFSTLSLDKVRSRSVSSRLKPYYLRTPRNAV